MNLNQKIKIDILEFFRSGKFDFIKLGKTKEWIINNFPAPDDIGMGNMRDTNIFKLSAFALLIK